MTDTVVQSCTHSEHREENHEGKTLKRGRKHGAVRLKRRGESVSEEMGEGGRTAGRADPTRTD